MSSCGTVLRVGLVCGWLLLGVPVLWTDEGRDHVLQVSLNSIETRIDPDLFLRVHRAHIVNLDRVRAFRPLDGGRMEAEMASGDRIPVSRRRASAIRALGI